MKINNNIESENNILNKNNKKLLNEKPIYLIPIEEIIENRNKKKDPIKQEIKLKDENNIVVNNKNEKTNNIKIKK